jgi:triacylglycerol lipase
MPKKTKQIPPPSVETVFPPNKGFVYYEHREEHPFEPRATTFSKVNAWWLAEAALLAYAKRDFASAAFSRAGLRLEGDQPFTGPSTQCYVAHNDDFVIVSFRGTEVLKPELRLPLPDMVRSVIRDLKTDAKFKLIESTLGGRVYRGFKEALAEVWERQVDPHLARLQREKARPVWFTGHSLGAALATLAARSHGATQGLYTFGSPMVGDETFAKGFRIESTYRFVNNNDLVTEAPFGPSGLLGVTPYRHVGHLRYIDSTGQILEQVSLLDRLADRLRGDLDSVADFAASLEGVPADHFNDHAPLYYAIHTWNSI